MILFLELLRVAVIILLNAFFVAGEYALVTARKTRIQELVQQGNRRARAVLKIVADPPRFIAAMQLGVTATSLAIGAIGEQALAKVFDPIFASVIAFTLAFLIITVLHVVVGELVPKGVALGHAETTALAAAARSALPGEMSKAAVPLNPNGVPPPDTVPEMSKRWATSLWSTVAPPENRLLSADRNGVNSFRVA